MRSPGRHRRPHRPAQHAAPTTAQTVAGAACKATPAALVGCVLLTGQSQLATASASAPAPAVWSQLTSFAPPPATTQVTPALNTPYADQVVQDWRVHSTPRPPVPEHVTTDALVRPLLEASISYTVQAGDTLSGIALKTLGNAADWRQIWMANRMAVPDPNVISIGQVLTIPGGPQSAKGSTPAGSKPAAATDTASATSDLSGTLSCAGLEALWESAGGSHAEAFMAAEIAMAESGGNQFAHSPTNDYGYWQINGVHGAEATFDPEGNARAAVAISDDGTDWGPWTTFTSGAYQGRC
jgi:LysM repeat protein